MVCTIDLHHVVITTAEVASHLDEKIWRLTFQLLCINIAQFICCFLSCFAFCASLLNQHIANNNNKYSFIKTSDKPQMNTTATTGISDASLPAPLLWCTMSQLKLVPTYTAWWTEAHVCKQLAQGCYVVAHRPGVNPRPFDHEADALPLSHHATHFSLITIHTCL